MITKIYDNGKLTSEKKSVNHDTLGMHLQSVEKALKDLGEHMVKSSK